MKRDAHGTRGIFPTETPFGVGENPDDVQTNKNPTGIDGTGGGASIYGRQKMRS